MICAPTHHANFLVISHSYSSLQTNLTKEQECASLNACSTVTAIVSDNPFFWAIWKQEEMRRRRRMRMREAGLKRGCA